MIIAIDGPAGSGKTTIAKRLAKKLSFLYLDTGATYRALTLKALQEHIALDDEVRLASLASVLCLCFEGDKVFLDGCDVSIDLRTPQIDACISGPASLGAVRHEIVKLQRRIVAQCDAVVEGRDITTVVFPQAEYKFYLDAAIHERAKRRHKELRARGVAISEEEVLEQMQKRDLADVNRRIAPLRRSSEAIYVDTTGLSIDEVLSILKEYIAS